MSSLPSSPPHHDEPFFHHPVSKLDTLAGLAIKYGVEVADIKRANGLSTDLQMFGYHTLKIPKPGEHYFPRSHEHKLSRQASRLMGTRNVSRPSQATESSKTRYKDRRTFYSATMNLLRGRSSSIQQIPCDEGTEMTCYHSNEHEYSQEDAACLRKTMKNERSLHASDSNTGIRKVKEISRVYNVDMPMATSVFNEVVTVNKNRNASGRCHFKFDAMSSVAEIRKSDTLGSMLQNSQDILTARTGSSIFFEHSFLDESLNEAFSSKVIKSPIASHSQASVILDVNVSETKSNNSRQLTK